MSQFSPLNIQLIVKVTMCKLRSNGNGRQTQRRLIFTISLILRFMAWTIILIFKRVYIIVRKSARRI